MDDFMFKKEKQESQIDGNDILSSIAFLLIAAAFVGAIYRGWRFSNKTDVEKFPTNYCVTAEFGTTDGYLRDTTICYKKSMPYIDNSENYPSLMVGHTTTVISAPFIRIKKSWEEPR